ncbi:MAG: hypothetical protein ABIH20_06135 [Candidatus Diapherotrites archaeon]
MSMKKKYEREIERWKKSEEFKDKVAGDGYPKTMLTPNQYEEFREEGEPAKWLFRTHFVRGKYIETPKTGNAMSGWGRKARKIEKE